MPRTRKKTGRKEVKPLPEAVTEVEESQALSEIDESVTERERTKPSPETVTEFEEPPPAVHGTYKKARAREEPCLLTPEQEVDIVEWFKENPCLYNKALREYRESEKKMRMYTEKAQEYGITEKQLRTWIESQRTRYGKLTAAKSGQGAAKLTERDTWICSSWSFLDEHIVRIPSRQSATKFVKSNATVTDAGTSASATSLAISSGSSAMDISDDDRYNSTDGNSESKTTPNGAHPTESTTQKMFDKIMAQMEKTREERRALQIPKTPHEAAVEAFAAYFATQCMQVHEEDWLMFTAETVQHLNTYVARARGPQYYGQQQQQIPLQQPACDRPYYPRMDPQHYQRGGNEGNDISLSEMNNISFSNMLLNSSPN